MVPGFGIQQMLPNGTVTPKEGSLHLRHLHPDTSDFSQRQSLSQCSQPWKTLWTFLKFTNPPGWKSSSQKSHGTERDPDPSHSLGKQGQNSSRILSSEELLQPITSSLELRNSATPSLDPNFCLHGSKIGESLSMLSVVLMSLLSEPQQDVLCFSQFFFPFFTLLL